ncbi:MAG: hypothetical protein AAF539_08050 [Planctomycetota bacterium]
MASIFNFQIYVYGPGGRPIPITMEKAAAAMQDFPGLYFEWDGSFTWAAAEPRWQISGTIYDNGSEIQYVDLHGRLESETARVVVKEKLIDLFSAWNLIAPDSNGRKSDQQASQSTKPGQHDWGFLNKHLAIMRLPDQRWQELQTFEQELLGLND